MDYAFTFKGGLISILQPTLSALFYLYDLTQYNHGELLEMIHSKTKIKLKLRLNMLRISKKTRLEREEIIDRAAKFFGKCGEGLDEKEKNYCCISFEGGGGYVSVFIAEEEKRRMVDVETREYEYQAKRFLERV